MKENLSFQQKVKIFMELMNEKEGLMPSSPLRFSDIDPTIGSHAKIYQWFSQTACKDLDLLLKECYKYKDLYPNACQRVTARFEKIHNSLSRNKKIELLMAYIENYDIPTGRSAIRFCDIAKDVKDTTRVGIFIQSNLENNEQFFFAGCAKYKDIYPKAFQKITIKIEKRHTINIQKERVRIYMEYMDNLQSTSIQEKIRFSDIDKSSVDAIQVLYWVYSQLERNLEWFKEECKKYKDIYPNAYYKMNSRIIALEKRREVGSLTFTKRVEAIMAYLEKQEILKIDKTLTFQDISLETDDVALINIWLINQLSFNQELLIEESKKYKELYPKGYQNLLLRKDNFIKESNRLSHHLSFEKKMELFMNYLEYSEEVNDKLNITFSDLDSSVEDDASVKNWVAKNLYRNLPKFIEEYSKYKEKYPNAYRKVTEKINNSQARIDKSRLLLLEELKYLRNSLTKEDCSAKVRRYRK